MDEVAERESAMQGTTEVLVIEVGGECDNLGKGGRLNSFQRSSVLFFRNSSSDEVVEMGTGVDCSWRIETETKLPDSRRQRILPLQTHLRTKVQMKDGGFLLGA